MATRPDCEVICLACEAEAIEWLVGMADAMEAFVEAFRRLTPTMVEAAQAMRAAQHGVGGSS